MKHLFRVRTKPWQVSFSHHSRQARRLGRGAASVEAAIILPFFVILFISVFYLRNAILARQAAEAHARSCAWSYSMNYCESVPAGCEDVVSPVSEGSKLADEIGSQLGKASNNLFAELIGDVLSAVLEPVVDAAFGKSLDANSQVSFPRPALYGGGNANATGTYHLACNIRDTTLTEVAENAWHTLF